MAPLRVTMGHPSLSAQALGSTGHGGSLVQQRDRAVAMREDAGGANRRTDRPGGSWVKDMEVYTLLSL